MANAAVSDKWVSRLAGVCDRLGSDHDGERSAAALIASGQLKLAGLSWSDLIQRAFTAVPQAPPVVSENPYRPAAEATNRSTRKLMHKGRLAREWLDELEEVSNRFSQWDTQFVKSVERQGARRVGLSEKQWTVLVDIASRAGVAWAL